MDEDNAVVVRDIRKEFILPQNKNTSLKQTFVNITRNKGVTTQTVLDGIDFEVKKGDFFGIVGRNGSGKSTLLKILAGVYSPTSGEVVLNGRLTPFIELGVGFNPELSGRDNVFLNGALLGFTHKQMEAMYDEIVEFAELEPFMDQKLKNYSSGMQVRLAFSIAIKAKNEILIFDEVLAVGDEAFQRKCFDVFERYKAEKQTVVLVTHDMETVRRFCNRAMLISEGKIVEIGNPRAVASRYSKLNQDSTDKSVDKQNQNIREAKYLKVGITDQIGQKRQSFNAGETSVFNIAWNGLPATKLESIGINIFKQSGEHVTGINTRFSEHSPKWKEKNQISIEFNLDVSPGKYYLLAVAFEEEGKPIDELIEGPTFTVKASKVEWSGLINLPHKWVEPV
jgi:ABC-2 type transport system ATP-binding protein